MLAWTSAICLTYAPSRAGRNLQSPRRKTDISRLRIVIAGVILLTASQAAQPVFRGSEIFPPEEFAARRARVAAALGDGVAIVLGTTEPPGEMPFRQNSQFFYLTGVAEPRASVIIDGRTRKTTLFLQPRTAKQEPAAYGPGLGPGPETAAAIGVDAVLSRADFTAAITAIAKDHRTIYTPFAAEVLGSQSQGDPTHLWTANAQDPWDGRDSREATFIARLKQAAPQSEIVNLDPVARRVCARQEPARNRGDSRSDRDRGSRHHGGDARRAGPGCVSTSCRPTRSSSSRIWRTGRGLLRADRDGPQHLYTHYNRNHGDLADGDLVQFDYAPDYKYYQSDVTRVFPANGKFTPRQREVYTIYLRYIRL